jgi:hypothetical protein
MLEIECKRFDPMRLYRLLKHWDITWRHQSNKAQLTRHCAVVIADFQAYVNWKIAFLGLDPRAIFNADQTNVYFSMETSFTLAAKGSKTVAIKGADSTARLTVMLCASMDGEKIPPYVIFKGSAKRTGRIIHELENKEGYPADLEYSVQPKAWMDEEKMLDWIYRVWSPFATQQNELTYLIIDECRTHMTANVRKAFLEVGTEVDYIPGGYTSKLQMLDVGVNKPFKNNVRHEFDTWLVGSESLKPQRQDVSMWIDAAWKGITVNTIVNSWRKCGIKHFLDDAAIEIDHEHEALDLDENDEDPLMGLEDESDIEWE